MLLFYNKSNYSPNKCFHASILLI